MHYVSTRGGTRPMAFEEVLLEGLATDGGLFIPESWPEHNGGAIRGLAWQDYASTAQSVLGPFFGTSFTVRELTELCAEAYRTFSHAAVAPLRQIGPNEWLLELFHGPTLAFKDFALQLLGRMFERVLDRKGERITVIGATSGDTGSAAIHACAGRDNIDVFILFPNGRISEVQRRQMTTVVDGNIHCIAVDGTFDDCQSLVKQLFGDETFRRHVSLAAINSINWARICAQIVYYYYSALRLGTLERSVRFVVPTGNFGDVYAGYVAAKTGLPISELVVATNSNDILSRFFATGTYERGAVASTLSPSMDIQAASNFERLLFDLNGRDAECTGKSMRHFAEQRTLHVEPGAMADLRPKFRAGRADEDETVSTIREVEAATGEVLDPHTAVGVSIGRKLPAKDLEPTVYLATAHPAKFPDAIRQALGRSVEPPERLGAIMEMKEHLTTMAGDPEQLKSFVTNHARLH